MSNSYSPRLVRSVIAFASVIMLVFLAITAVNAWTSYKTALSDAEMRAQTTADLLRQQVQTTIKISQLVVDSMVTHGQKERIEGNHVGISHDHHLMYMASHLPFSPWLVEIDANGRQRYMQKTRESNSDPAPTALKNTVEHSSAPHTPHSGSMSPGRPEATAEIRPVEDREAYKAYLAMHRDQQDSSAMIGPPIQKTSGEG